MKISNFFYERFVQWLWEYRKNMKEIMKIRRQLEMVFQGKFEFVFYRVVVNDNGRKMYVFDTMEVGARRKYEMYCFLLGRFLFYALDGNELFEGISESCFFRVATFFIPEGDEYLVDLWRYGG